MVIMDWFPGSWRSSIPPVFLQPPPMSTLRVCVSTSWSTQRCIPHRPLLKCNEYLHTLSKWMAHTAIGQAENTVTNLKAIVCVCAKFLDYSRKFDTHGARSLRRNRVFPLALEQVHSVQPECFDLDQSLARTGLWYWDLVNEQSIGTSFAPLDIWVFLANHARESRQSN